MSRLFSPLTLRGVTARNRVFVSPMCQYSCVDGMPDDWHLVHLGSRAVGGAGLVMVEATAVLSEGRISPADSGIWNESQAEAWRRVARFIKEHGAVPAIQLAHAGRKASTRVPWDRGQGAAAGAGGWTPLGPTDEPFDADYPKPRAMTARDIEGVVAAFAAASARAKAAGFEAVELHFAHGYLAHEFLSPLVNTRTDSYGGSFEHRVRFAVEIARSARKAWPERLPLFARVSATDWVSGGWDVEQTVELARRLKAEGVDLIDCSSGGAIPGARIPVGPGYQVPLAERVRREAEIPTAAVGLITEPAQADDVVASGRADAVFLARELLRSPYWPLHAARALGADAPWPKQYLRAKN